MKLKIHVPSDWFSFFLGQQWEKWVNSFERNRWLKLKHFWKYIAKNTFSYKYTFEKYIFDKYRDKRVKSFERNKWLRRKLELEEEITAGDAWDTWTQHHNTPLQFIQLTLRETPEHNTPPIQYNSLPLQYILSSLPGKCWFYNCQFIL